MSRTRIVKQSLIKRTPRVMQVEGMFDIPPSERTGEAWELRLELPDKWNIGLIVGPSGSGKTTIAKELFNNAMVCNWQWSMEQSLLDDFPPQMSIKEITTLLSSVGFSSPPSWLRSFHVLSNGEQFRVNMARAMAENTSLFVVDEFTSVVDRTVAQIGSSAIQKAIRKRNQQFIAVSCHYDIIDWLEPDWVYQPHTGELLVGRSLHCRPPIKLDIKRVHHSAWGLFRKHHYLDTELNKSAVCFVAFWNSIPVAFSAWLHFPHAKKRNLKREHRTVTLPDYQGVGIGNALSNYIASMWKSLGFIPISTTSNPSMIFSRNQSSNWVVSRKSSRTAFAGRTSSRSTSKSVASNRLTVGFEFVGIPMDTVEARNLLNG